MDMETPIREADQRSGHRTSPVSEPPVAHGLQVVSIAKSYDKRTVLTDVSVSVGRGEVIGLLGRTARARRPASIRSWAW